LSNYQRTFILTPAESLNTRIYLLDLTHTNVISNALIIDDLFNDYQNASIYVKKIIEDEVYQITADFVDIERKIPVFLIENHEYIIEVHSDTSPTIIMGYYTAYSTGEKVMQLYDVDISTDVSQFNKEVSYRIYTKNVSGNLTAYLIYNDISNLTHNVVFQLRRDTYNGTVIGTLSSTEQDFILSYNIQDYANLTLYTNVYINHTTGEYTIQKLLHYTSGIVLGILEYVGQDFMNWFFTILLSVLAIFGTIKTANYYNLVLIGIASFFVIIGWYKVTFAVLALAALVSLATLLIGGSKK